MNRTLVIVLATPLFALGSFSAPAVLAVIHASTIASKPAFASIAMVASLILGSARGRRSPLGSGRQFDGRDDVAPLRRSLSALLNVLIDDPGPARVRRIRANRRIVAPSLYIPWQRRVVRCLAASQGNNLGRGTGGSLANDGGVGPYVPARGIVGTYRCRIVS